jgi:hypothetical protein
MPPKEGGEINYYEYLYVLVVERVLGVFIYVLSTAK